LGEGAKGGRPFPLPQTPTPNPISRGDPLGRPQISVGCALRTD